jgi:hypothetical protein
MAMKRLRSRHLILFLPAMAIAVLAVAVFLWGVAYKCSLYPVRSNTRPHMPAAKLLTEQERPQATPPTHSLCAPVFSPIFFALGLLLFAAALRPRNSGREGLPTCWRVGTHRISCLSHFFFRPPPALAL